MTAPHMHLTGVDKLIMAAQMESNHPLPPAMPFYFREPTQIPTPRNKSELELYQLLRRANLIDYFPTFLRFGGDDVEQLAEASEDEFIEIIELIGIDQKPLHVRRLQKALSQWRNEKFEALALGSDRRPGFYYDTAGLYANHAAPNLMANQRADTSIRSELTQCSSSLLDESFGPPSSASRSLFPVNQDDHKQNSADTPKQYCTPHHVIRNAPKRPRLMDSIMPSDLTKGIQLYDSSVHSTPVKHPPRGRSLEQSTDQPGGPQPTTPAEKRHPIQLQILPPDSPESDSDDNSNGAKSRGRARRKAPPTKSK